VLSESRFSAAPSVTILQNPYILMFVLCMPDVRQFDRDTYIIHTNILHKKHRVSMSIPCLCFYVTMSRFVTDRKETLGAHARVCD